jgi:phosphodiesterase/alkaline phosphatase D-like protein
VAVAKPSVKAAPNRKLIIDWAKFRAKISLRPFWPNTQVVEVQYGTDPSFQNVAGTRAVPKWKLTQGKGKTTLKGLKKNRYYYVRVRLSDGQGVYSRWSPAAKVRTKK